MKERNEFYEPLLRFRIARPQDWEFRPGEWSPAAQVRNLDDWKRHARLNFVSLVKQHASEAHAGPRVHVGACPLDEGVAADDTFARTFLNFHVASFRRDFPGVEISTASIAETVAGHRANKMVGEYTMSVQKNGFVRPYHLIGRAYTIFAPGRIFMVGMTSSTDPRYYHESDFEEILRSISID